MHVLHDLVAEWRRRGVELRLRDGVATLTPHPNAPTTDMVALTDQLQPELVALLSSQPIGESWRRVVSSWPADVREFYEERAAVREYDGNLPRPLAELLAYRDVEAWLQRKKGNPS